MAARQGPALVAPDTCVPLFRTVWTSKTPDRRNAGQLRTARQTISEVEDLWKLVTWSDSVPLALVACNVELVKMWQVVILEKSGYPLPPSPMLQKIFGLASLALVASLLGHGMFYFLRVHLGVLRY